MKWVQAQRESFRQYLMQNKIVQFRYKGRQYEVETAGCTVMSQCYSAVAENLKDFKGMNLLADIDNGTMNIMYLNNGRAMESKSFPPHRRQVEKCLNGKAMWKAGRSAERREAFVWKLRIFAADRLMGMMCPAQRAFLR